MVVLAVIIGLISGICNFAFRKSIDFFEWLIVTNGSRLTGYSAESWDLSRLWACAFPLAGALLMIPLFIFFREDMSFGFPRFLEAVNLQGGKLRPRHIFTRGIASALTIGSGGSAGQEGPIAQIGGAAGSLFGQVLGMSGERLKILIGCGVSGGVAATFNAPIAGVFFAHEIVLLSSFELNSFTSIVISSGMSTVVSRVLLGNAPAFIVPNYELNHPVELIFYALLGGIVGWLAAFFINSYSRSRKLFAGFGLPPWQTACIGGLLVGMVAIFMPQISGNGYHFIEDVVSNRIGWQLLTLLIVAKLVATCLTVGSGLPGGLFAPALFIGAVTGGSFGYLINHLFPHYAATPGAYALVGMGAFLAAVVHAPMTGIFLLFEVTNSYHIIVPIMITCVIGTIISRRFNSEGIDTVDLAEQGIDLKAGKEQNILKTISVRDAMSKDPETLPDSMTLREFNRFISTTRYTSFPLVNRDGELAGIISVQDFLGVVFDKDLEDLVVLKELATEEVITATEQETLAEALARIGYRNIEMLPVVSRQNPRQITGILSRRDIIRAYNKEVLVRGIGK